MSGRCQQWAARRLGEQQTLRSAGMNCRRRGGGGPGGEVVERRKRREGSVRAGRMLMLMLEEGRGDRGQRMEGSVEAQMPWIVRLARVA